MDTDEVVTNEHGIKIDFDAATVLMDDDLREELHNDLPGMLGKDNPTEQEFFNAYASAHQERFGETWELAKANPVW